MTPLPEAASQSDPLLVSVVSVALTLVVTLVVGVVTALLARKGEHAKWLREQRYEAYVAFMIDMSALTSLIEAKPSKENASGLKARAEALVEGMPRAFEAVSLLGPRKVNMSGQRWVWAASTYAKDKSEANKTAVGDARWQFLSAAGEVLKSKNVTEDRIVKPDTPPRSAATS